MQTENRSLSPCTAKNAHYSTNMFNAFEKLARVQQSDSNANLDTTTKTAHMTTVDPHSVFVGNETVCTNVKANLTACKAKREIEHPSQMYGQSKVAMSRERLMSIRQKMDNIESTDIHRQVVDAILNFVESKLSDVYSVEDEGQLWLITGSPGTGKSYIIMTLEEHRSHIQEIPVMKSSIMGGAATAIGGSTCCTAFEAPPFSQPKFESTTVKEVDAQRIVSLRKRLGKDNRWQFGIVICDKMSMLSAAFLSIID